MNFRERLSEVKEEKFKAKGDYKKTIETILEKLLQYFNSQDVFSILNSRRFYWGFGGNVVYVKYVESNGIMNNAILFQQPCNSEEDARLILVYLEQKFADEGYEIITPKSSVTCGNFQVIITP